MDRIWNQRDVFEQQLERKRKKESQFYRRKHSLPQEKMLHATHAHRNISFSSEVSSSSEAQGKLTVSASEPAFEKMMTSSWSCRAVNEEDWLSNFRPLAE